MSYIDSKLSNFSYKKVNQLKILSACIDQSLFRTRTVFLLKQHDVYVDFLNTKI